MTEQTQRNELKPITSAGKAGDPKPPAEKSKLPSSAGTNGPNAEPGVTPPVDTLTPEEQMRLFEKELKEKDWGHQPC